MLSIKTHESYRKVVALCDSNLIGKKFEDGKRQLDVRENFFKGEEIERGAAIVKLRALQDDDATFNIVGKESVEAALDAGIITMNNVGKIGEIPIALVLL